MVFNPFSDDDERDEITLKSGAKVWVRQALSAETRAAFQRALIQMELDAATGRVQVRNLSWEQNAILVCQAYILDWDFVDLHGNAVPYSKDRVPRLKEDVLDEISQGIDKLQTERREINEKKEP